MWIFYSSAAKVCYHCRMNLQESINRGFNLLAVSITGLAGFAFLPEVFVENDVPDKIDDALLFVLALVGMFWYRRSNNRYMRSVLPVALVVLGLVVKFGGLLVELDDPEAFGDDVGGLILFILGTGLVIHQYVKTGKMLKGQQ